MNAVSTSTYLLGHEAREHARLIRQAETVAPYTTRLFQRAGIGPGQRVLDLGSGVGDVALLAGDLVGPTGYVLGVERDPDALILACRRSAATDSPSTFVQCELTAPTLSGLFDAIVGRFVAMFLPNPQETIRQIARHLRPGGVFVLQEPAWSLFFPASTALPLRTACGRLICNALRSSGARPDMGLEVHSAMLDAGLIAPRTVVDIPTADDPDGGHWFPDLIATLDAQLAGSFDSRNELGQLSSLGERLTQEAIAKKVCAPLVPLVGTFARSCAV